MRKLRYEIPYDTEDINEMQTSRASAVDITGFAV